MRTVSVLLLGGLFSINSLPVAGQLGGTGDGVGVGGSSACIGAGHTYIDTSAESGDGTGAKYCQCFPVLPMAGEKVSPSSSSASADAITSNNQNNGKGSADGKGTSTSTKPSTDSTSSSTSGGVGEMNPIICAEDGACEEIIFIACNVVCAGPDACKTSGFAGGDVTCRNGACDSAEFFESAADCRGKDTCKSAKFFKGASFTCSGGACEKATFASSSAGSCGKKVNLGGGGGGYSTDPTPPSSDAPSLGPSLALPVSCDDATATGSSQVTCHNESGCPNVTYEAEACCVGDGCPGNSPACPNEAACVAVGATYDANLNSCTCKKPSSGDYAEIVCGGDTSCLNMEFIDCKVKCDAAASTSTSTSASTLSPPSSHWFPPFTLTTTTTTYTPAATPLFTSAPLSSTSKTTQPANGTTTDTPTATSASSYTTTTSISSLFGSCQNAIFDGSSEVSCVSPSSCSEAIFTGQTKAECSDRRSCTSAIVERNATLTCSDKSSCEDLSASGSSKITCSQLNSCMSATFRDNVEADCSGVSSCMTSSFWGSSVGTCGNTSACKGSSFNRGTEGKCTERQSCMGTLFARNATCTGDFCPPVPVDYGSILDGADTCDQKRVNITADNGGDGYAVPYFSLGTGPVGSAGISGPTKITVTVPKDGGCDGVGDLNVQISIDSSLAGYMTMFLTSPSGTSVELASFNGYQGFSSGTSSTSPSSSSSTSLPTSTSSSSSSSSSLSASSLSSATSGTKPPRKEGNAVMKTGPPSTNTVTTSPTTTTGTPWHAMGYDNAIFNDEATYSIEEGRVPFQGSYRPKVPLSVFDGESAAGDWIFTVSWDYLYGTETSSSSMQSPLSSSSFSKSPNGKATAGAGDRRRDLKGLPDIPSSSDPRTITTSTSSSSSSSSSSQGAGGGNPPDGGATSGGGGGGDGGTSSSTTSSFNIDVPMVEYITLSLCCKAPLVAPALGECASVTEGQVSSDGGSNSGANGSGDGSNGGSLKFSSTTTISSASSSSILAIPDGPGDPLSIPLEFAPSSGGGSGDSQCAVADVTLQVAITHSYVEDLTLTLSSPDNDVTVVLTSANGGDGVGYMGTIFDDSAKESVVSGKAPFLGSYKPEGKLSDFWGVNAVGTWILTIEDTLAKEVGSLLSATLHVCCEK